MLSWFRKKKKSSDTKSQPIEQLANLLKEHGSTILENKGRFCLTTPVLISLNQRFQQLCFGRAKTNSDFQVIVTNQCDEDVALVFDFAQKSPNLKLESGPVCYPSPQLCLLPFKSLQILEIRRVPITYLRGLHHIAKHIKTLTCHRSTESIKDVIYQFGRDFNGVLTLPVLKTLDLSYNTITCLDQSLKLLPSLESLVLCYNCLVDADSEFIPPVKQLNLGYNSIIRIPSYSLIASKSLTNLILCNNSLTNIHGLEMFSNLRILDISSNCLISFDHLVPLARLQFLSTLSLKGNPVEFTSKYRLEVISRMSPFARIEPVSLDGQILSESEMLNLGLFVQPAPLRSYIPQRPLGRPSGSLVNLMNSVTALSERDPVGSSTPNNTHRKHSSRRKGKIREAIIVDETSPKNIIEISAANPSLSRNDMERQDSFGSRRNSTDDSVMWIHKNSSGEVVEVSKSLPDIDYAMQLEPEPLTMALGKESYSADDILAVAGPDDSIYNNSSAAFDMNSDSGSTGSSISVITDDDKEPFYLVESVVGEDKNSLGEKESIFVLFKHPYLIEKDPVTGQVIKLDLNYLQEVLPFPNGTLRVSLKFDLVRLDRQKRLYLFEDIDHVEEFNEFVSRLTPFAMRNRITRESKMEKYRCLKCSTKFKKPNSETSFALCPNCKSSMVVEQAGETDLRQESLTNIDDGDKNRRMEYGDTVTDLPISELSLKIASSDSLAREDSSIVVLARTGRSGLQSESNSNVMSEDEACLDDQSLLPTIDIKLYEETLSTSDNCSRNPIERYSTEPQSSETSMVGSTGTVIINNTNSGTKLIGDGTRSDGCAIEDHGDIDSSSTDVKGGFGKFKSFLKGKVSGSQGSSVDKNSDHEIESDTRCITPSTSYGSRNSQSRNSQMNGGKSSATTPIQDAPRNRFIPNKDDLEKCDHRLKLYFSMDLFKSDEEDFRCMIQCACVRFDKSDIDACLLLISTKSIYLFKLRPNESDSPKKWLHLIIKYGFTELKYIDYCYQNQSFRLEFDREYGSYKFIVSESKRCQHFLSILLNMIQDVVIDKQNFPIVQEEPNPRTLVNIRTQIFGLKEDLISMAKRLYLQATTYTVPSLFKCKKLKFRTHQQCVTGKDLVHWLVTRREVKSRLDAVTVCQKLIDVGILYHISKELQFEDGDAVYKFCFSDNSKKISSPALQRIGSMDASESDSSQNSLDAMEMSSDVCLYSMVEIRMDSEDSCFAQKSLFLTKTHLFVVNESHHWPLSRIYQPPSFLKEQFKMVASQRVIDLIKMTFFEDSPCHVLLDFVDELCDAESRETSWLILTETLRERNKLTDALKTMWEEEIKVEIMTDVWPTINLAL